MDPMYSHALVFIRHKQARRHKKLVRAPTLIHNTGLHVATATYQHVHTTKVSSVAPTTSSLCPSKNLNCSTESRPTIVQSSKESLRNSSGFIIPPVITHTKRKPTTSLPRKASKDKSPEMLSSSNPKKNSSDTILLRRWISQSISQVTDEAPNWFDLSWSQPSGNHTECESLVLMFEDLVPLLCTVESSLFLKTFQIVPGISIGILLLPPYEKKSAANTRDNSLVFFVIQGLVKITVNGDSFTATKASHFMILQDSVYQFASESDSDTVMYFVHIMH